MILADKILALRKKNGWSQEELAEKIGVSRQAISKWEGAQSMPDLDRILKMSELFGVSTDYLMKDDFVGNPSSEQEDTLLPQVSLEDANKFLKIRRTTGHWISLGVALLVAACIPSIIGGSIEGTSNADLAVTVGVICTLIMVAGGITLFIRSHYLTGEFDWMEKESFEIGFGVEGMVKERKKEALPHNRRKTVLAIIALVLGIAFMVASETLETLIALPMFVSIVLGFVGIALAMYLFVNASYSSASYDLLLQEEDYRAEKKKVSEKIDQVIRVFWLVVVAGFLAYSFITKDWGHSWIFFPVAGVLDVALRLLLDVFLVGKEE